MVVAPLIADNFSLDDFMANPPDGMEWIDGQLMEKNGMTLPHSEIQANLAFYWKSYAISSGQGGKVYTDVPCRTNQQGRSPDVAYLTPELAAQYGKSKALPHSFPLCAEIISPTDMAEEVFLKAQEYLASGSLEVWLVFPDSQLVLVLTDNQILGFRSGTVASTQKVLIGFSLAVDELFA